ncbi:hypothetical protein MN608_06721 [Microdochium nivale]|nr:hypothetical protein MN608_06721 [Microdochium nivale]
MLHDMQSLRDNSVNRIPSAKITPCTTRKSDSCTTNQPVSSTMANPAASASSAEARFGHEAYTTLLSYNGSFHPTGSADLSTISHPSYNRPSYKRSDGSSKLSSSDENFSASRSSAKKSNHKRASSKQRGWTSTKSSKSTTSSGSTTVPGMQSAATTAPTEIIFEDVEAEDDELGAGEADLLSPVWLPTGNAQDFYHMGSWQY